MIEDFYYIAARSLMKWSPEVREQLLDKLGAYERECVLGYCARIQEREERFRRGMWELSDYIQRVVNQRLKAKGLV